MTSVGNTADCVVSDDVGGSVVENNTATVVVLSSGVVEDNEDTVVVFGSGGVDENEATVVFGSGIDGSGSAMASLHFGPNSDRRFALREPRILKWRDNKHVIRLSVMEPASEVTGTGDIWDSHVHTEHVIRPCVMKPLSTEGTF